MSFTVYKCKFSFLWLGLDGVYLVLLAITDLMYQPQMTEEYGAIAGMRISSRN
jgi:hypothetical protein